VSRSELFLGVIALATLSTAIVQIAVLVTAGRVVRKLARTADRLEGELTPLIGHLTAIGRDASHATTLAVAQLERADRLFADIAEQAVRTLNTFQAAVTGPMRESAAIISALKAAIQTIREMRADRRGGRVDDEDALFI
jgi:hypothetical protein